MSLHYAIPSPFYWSNTAHNTMVNSEPFTGSSNNSLKTICCLLGHDVMPGTSVLTCYLQHLGDFSIHQNEGCNKSCWNCSPPLYDYMVEHQRKHLSSESPPSEPQISHNTCITFGTNILEHKYIFNLQLWHMKLMHLPYCIQEDGECSYGVCHFAQCS